MLKKSSTAILLTITSIEDSIFIIKNDDSYINYYENSTAKGLIKSKKRFSLTNNTDFTTHLKDFNYFSISNDNSSYKGVLGFKNNYFTGHSKNGFDWKIDEKLSKNPISAYVEPSSNEYLYWSDEDIHLGVKSNKEFILEDDPIYSTGHDTKNLKILNVISNNDATFVPISSEVEVDGNLHQAIFLSIFENKDPRKIKYRLTYPIWLNPDKFKDQNLDAISILEINKEIYSFWLGEHKIYRFRHPQLERLIYNFPKEKYLTLEKADHNPILSPNQDSDWESIAVFNPAALYDDEENKLHIVYRAVGKDWRSTLGYASSSDGMNIDCRNNLPCYVPRAPFEGQSLPYNPNPQFNSGPGAGGCEDPRLTKIDNKVYLTYVAYNGWQGGRIAISSIPYEDFKNGNFNSWSYPKLISRPGVTNKNAVIFPEKVNGKYAIMHRVFPDILIDYVDSLEFDGKKYLKGEFKITPTKSGWDSRKIAAGPPPLKTKFGWLLIYHAVDNKKDNQYHAGAMILDINDPTKVLARSTKPIISPTHWYENEGFKAGIVYPCGAAIIDNILNVYYGGSDTFVCVASTPIDSFLDDLMTHTDIESSHIKFN